MHHCRSRTIQLADCTLKSYVSVQADTARPIMLRATNIRVTTSRDWNALYIHKHDKKELIHTYTHIAVFYAPIYTTQSKCIMTRHLQCNM